MNFWLTPDGYTFDYYKSDIRGPKPTRKGQAIHMAFVGGSLTDSVGVGGSRLVNAYYGSKSGRHNASSFQEVLSRSIYPGIDARSYTENGRPRYDLLVAAGSDPAQIKFKVEGANTVKSQGDCLTFGTTLGDLKQCSLVAYQVVAGQRHTVPASFEMVGKDQVRFRIGSYDHTRSLTIDPLIYGSYYGGDLNANGTAGIDEVRSVASDGNGGTFLTGYTQQVDFPSIYGPYSYTLNGTTAAFLSRLEGDAYVHDYAAYIGGSLADFGLLVEVDSNRDVWVIGRSYSSDFPDVNGFPGTSRNNVQYITDTGGLAFTLTYSFGGGISATTPLEPAGVSTATLQADLTTALNSVLGATAIPSSGMGSIVVNSFNSPAGGSTMATGATYQVILPGGPVTLPNGTVVLAGGLPGLLSGIPAKAVATGTGISVGKVGDIFAMRFKQNNANVPALDPATVPAIAFMGSGQEETVAGFGFVPAPPKGRGITFVIGGDVLPSVPNVPAGTPSDAIAPGAVLEVGSLGAPVTGSAPPPGQLANTPHFSGYVATLNYSGAKTAPWSQVTATSGFLTDSVAPPPAPGIGLRLTGLATDSAGSIFLGGTVFSNTTIDTTKPAGSAEFYTSPNLNFGPYLGYLVRQDDIFVRKYSSAGGTPIFSALIGGNGDDLAGGFTDDLYTRTSTTPGAFTNTGSCVAVDSADDVYVTGISGSWNFPRTRGVYGEDFNSNPVVIVTKMHFDPVLNLLGLVYSTNLQTAGEVVPGGIAVDQFGDAFVIGNLQNGGTVQTTMNAVVQSVPKAGGWINLLNPTATALLYGSAAGDQLFGPYLDVNGDLWLFGSSNGTINPYLTQHAFKNYSIGPDGFVARQRLVLPIVSTITVTPSPINGGNGAPMTATMTLSSAVPGNVNATLSLSDPIFATKPVTSVAFVNPGGKPILDKNGIPVQNQTFVIPAGSSSLSVNLVSFSVQQNTAFQLQGNLNGSFRIVKSVVQPWINSVTLTKNTFVAGAPITGTINLTSPSTGLVVTLDTSPVIPNVIPQKITIPAGQSSYAFSLPTSAPLTTNGEINLRVYVDTFTQTTAYTSNAFAKPLTLAASANTVSSVTFDTNPVNSSSTVNVTATLKYPAPAGGLTLTLGTSDPNLAPLPIDPKTKQTLVVTVPAGQTTASYPVITGLTAANATATITVTAGAGDAGSSAVLKVTGFAPVLTFSASPVMGSYPETGTITVAFPAPKTGLTFAMSSSNPSEATFPATVKILAGTTSATYTITVTPLGANDVDVITATLATKVSSVSQAASAKLKITGYTPTFSFAYNPIVGANTEFATVTISSPAPVGGLVIGLVSSNTSLAKVPANVKVPAGTMTVNFTFPVSDSPTNTSFVVGAVLNGVSYMPATVNVLGHWVTGLTFESNPVVGGTETVGIVTISQPAPAAGTIVHLSLSGSGASVPATVVVAPGETTGYFVISTTSVTTSVSATVSASCLGGAPVTESLQVIPAG